MDGMSKVEDWNSKGGEERVMLPVTLLLNRNRIISERLRVWLHPVAV